MCFKRICCENGVAYLILGFENGCTVYRQVNWNADLEIMFDFPITVSFQNVVDIVQMNVDEGLFV